MLVLNLPSFQNKQYTIYDCFHVNGPNGKITDQKKTERRLGLTSRLLTDRACSSRTGRILALSHSGKDLAALSPYGQYLYPQYVTKIPLVRVTLTRMIVGKGITYFRHITILTILDA